MLKKYSSISSFVLFLIGVFFYMFAFLGYDMFLLPVVIISVIGFATALFGVKNVYRTIGLFGNGVILVIALFIPFVVTTFFWNKP